MQNSKYGKSINKETQDSIDKITSQIPEIRFTTPRVHFEGLYRPTQKLYL